MANKQQVKQQLFTTLLNQQFPYEPGESGILTACKNQAENYVALEGNIAVLSDFQADFSHIYIGAFGSQFGLPTGYSTINSAFEEGVFEKIHPDDLIARHILELNYFRLQSKIPPEKRQAYSTHCHLRIMNAEGQYMTVIHRTIYLRSFRDGSIWLALCLYSPAATTSNGIEGKVINSETGEITLFEDQKLLSRRETEIINYIAKGLDSGQIASQIHLSVFTVRRHRQNILQKLKAPNTSAAIKICAAMGLLQ